MTRRSFARGLSALVCACALVSISAFSPPEGFVSIFNGSNLDGWTSKQKDGWKSKDGILQFDGSSNMSDANLWTTKKYRNYVFTFDYRVRGKHDGARDIGVMLRENAAFNFEQHLPNHQWSRAVITVRDFTPEIEVRGISPDVLNGITVEMELNGKPFSKTTFTGVPKEGPIALQPRRFPIEFANIHIKELPEKSSPEAFVPPDGFVPLFNGRNLDGWKTSLELEKHWIARNGFLKNSTMLPSEDSATLWTEKSYSNYTLLFDWRPVGKERPHDLISLYVYNGPPHRLDLKGNPDGSWNRAEISVRSGTASWRVNGLSRWRKTGADSSRVFETGARHGAIGFEDPSFPVQFANIYIKELPLEAPKQVALRSDGFIPLFDGPGINGWKLSSETKHWRANDSILEYDGKGTAEASALRTTRNNYHDFVMLLDWRVPRDAKMKDDVAIHIPNMPDTFYLKNDKPAGEWNRATLTSRNNTAQLEVNGKIVQKKESEFVPHTGSISLKGGSHPIDFANIYIKELAAEKSKPEVSLLSEGFVPLELNLDRWEISSLGAGWKVNDAVLENHSGHSAIISPKKYRDYVLIFDWRVPQDDPHSNAPYLYIDRGPRPTGVRERFRTALFFPAKTVPPNLVGTWNRSRITVKGDRCIIELNDRVVRTAENLSGGNEAGKFGIGRDGARLDVANIYIKELK